MQSIDKNKYLDNHNNNYNNKERDFNFRKMNEIIKI